MTFRWNSGSLGFPRGRPRGNSQWRARGGAVDSICPLILESATVANPACSSTDASVPTVRVHNGQTGVSRTRSTSSSFNSFAAAGPLAHYSPNFDRVGWVLDKNVVFPIDRLNELAEDGTIGSVAKTHISFMGAQPDHTLETIRLDSGPAAAKLLADDEVDLVLLTPV